MIKNIFFDFDGVIIDSTEVKSRAFYNIYLPYGEKIASRAKDYHLGNGGISRYEKFKWCHQNLLGEELTKDNLNDMAQKFSHLVFQEVVNAPLIEGVEEFIKKNYNQMSFFIISGTPTSELQKICKELDISKFFHEICGSPTKKPEWGKIIIEKYRLKEEETIFIGDSTTDYRAAQELSIPFILRIHLANEAYFGNYGGIRVKNFTTLEKTLQNL